MATERLISAQASPLPEDEALNWSLRPTSIGEYVGQADLIERLRIAMAAGKGRAEPLEHILLHGPPGLGKTTLAHVIGQEMGARVHVTSGPALSRPTDLVRLLTNLQARDILFIDEVHRLPVAVEEFIYPAMEDLRIDICVDSGINAQAIQLRLKPFTLIAATTRAGLLSGPLRSRFGLVHHLKFYSPDELLIILRRSAGLLGMRISADAALDAIAARSRGTPRIANRLLRRVRDFAQVRAGGSVTPSVVDGALQLESVDVLGLDDLDRAYLNIIGGTYEGGPVGLEAVAASMSEDAGTLEDVVEPFLLQLGFLARTRRGRMLTRAGADHLGLRFRPPDEATQRDLFAPGADPAQL